MVYLYFLQSPWWSTECLLCTLHLFLSFGIGITASNNASNNLHVLKGSYQKKFLSPEPHILDSNGVW